MIYQNTLKLVRYVHAQNKAQLKEISANMHKGDPVDYAEGNTDLKAMLDEIQHHVNKVKLAAEFAHSESTDEQLREYCADVCNCVLFLMINRELL